MLWKSKTGRRHRVVRLLKSSIEVIGGKIMHLVWPSGCSSVPRALVEFWESRALSIKTSKPDSMKRSHSKILQPKSRQTLLLKQQSIVSIKADCASGTLVHTLKATLSSSYQRRRRGTKSVRTLSRSSSKYENISVKPTPKRTPSPPRRICWSEKRVFAHRKVFAWQFKRRKTCREC